MRKGIGVEDTRANKMTLLKTEKSLKGRRWLILLCVLLVLLAGAAVGSWQLPPTSPISKANYNRIAKGMTEEEVTQILGPPAYFHLVLFPDEAPLAKSVTWGTDTHCIQVLF
jgi:hypothetical protein